MIKSEAATLLSKAKTLIEAACDIEELKEVKDDLKDVTEKIEDIIEDGKDTKKADKADDKDEKKDEDLKELVNETVDALYEKAVMCESAEEANVYIAKADELQKAIEDIPEEKPVVDDEYPTDVTGGEGAKIDQEEIKELVGDDAETLKLLNSDPQSATIDA